MGKRILLLNAGHNDLGMLQALKKMNAYVIVTGNRENLIGQKYADEYIKADYSDKEKVLQIAGEKRIDAVCACCNDLGVMTAAYVAEKMKLGGHDSYETVLKIHHKNRFKKVCARLNILTPEAFEFRDYHEAVQYIQDGILYPVIVKPVDCSAGNGISRADDGSQALSAVKEAFQMSATGEIVIEEFVEGEQAACCTFLHHKKVIACCSNNEYSIVNPYRVEIDTFPAKGFQKVKGILIQEIEKIAEALELSDGIFHVQYRVKDGKPYILEGMRRVLGNMYGIPAEKASGFDWDYWEALSHCGFPLDSIPNKTDEEGFYAYRAVMAGKNGHIKNVTMDSAVQKYIFDQCMLWEKGQEIKNYQSEPLGFYFMKFESMEEMHHVMLGEYDKIVVEMEE